jgi:hypothetical protein
MKISDFSKSLPKRYIIGLILLSFVLLFALPNGVTTGLAQEQEQELKLSILRVDSQDFPQLSAYVTVVDQAGLPMMALEADDFEMSEDRTPISSPQIESETGEGVWLVLALDTSMNNQVFAETQAHLKAFIDTMRPQDQMAITTFADKAEESLAFTSDKDQLSRFIDALSATQKETTATYQAATFAVDFAAQRGQEGRSAAILITDSGNVGGTARPVDQDTLEGLKNKELPLYVVGFGIKTEAENLRSLTDETMGESYLVFGPDEMSATLQTLGVQLRQAYRLTWESQLPFDEESHDLVVNLASRSQEPPVTNSFTIDPSARPPFSVELLVVPSTFPIGESVLVQAKVEGRQVSSVEFLRDGSLFDTLKEYPYRTTIETNNYSVGEHQITVRVHDTLGEQQEDSATLQVQPAPQGLLEWVLPRFWPAFSLLLLLLITLWLLGKLLAWQRGNLRQKFALKIANEGNMPSRYELRAEEKGIHKTLRFEFFHRDQPLNIFQPPQPVQAPARAQNSQAASNQATSSSPTGQSATTGLGDISDRVQGASQFLSNLAAVLGPFGKPIRGALNSVSQTFMSGRNIVQIPTRIMGRLGISLPSPSMSGDSSPQMGGVASPTRRSQRTSASTAQVQTVVKPSLVTPTVGAGRTLWIDLFVTPPWRFLTGVDYAFTIVSRLMDQRISEVKTIKGKLNLSSMRWYRRFLPLLLFLIVTLAMSFPLALLVLWVKVAIG